MTPTELEALEARRPHGPVVEELIAEVRRGWAFRERAWDLLRHQRGELHISGLISDEEYGALVRDHAAVGRLESYDEVKQRAKEQLQRAESLQLRLLELLGCEEDKARLDWLALTWMPEPDDPDDILCALMTDDPAVFRACIDQEMELERKVDSEAMMRNAFDALKAGGGDAR